MATHYTDKEIINALRKSKGIISDAAKLIEGSRTTIYARIKSSPAVAAVHEEVTQSTTDWVESKLLDKIEEGDTRCILFYLQTKAKDRGYTKEITYNGTTDGNMTISVVYGDNGDEF